MLSTLPRSLTTALTVATVATVALSLDACERPASLPAARAYTPVTRQITITTVPLLVKEEAKTFPFLAGDFAKGGVLDGKEVYGFSPSTVTVIEGDTIDFSFINPEDDDHSFVLPDFVVALKPQAITHGHYIARHAGIFPFTCAVASHMPMMNGQLVVLAPTAAQSQTTGPSATK